MLYEMTALREQYILDGWDKVLRSNYRTDDHQSTPQTPGAPLMELAEDDAF
jgi:hypothetical protein